ncbi:uL15 family ribosomal protein, partial [Rectinema subterraneum]
YRRLPHRGFSNYPFRKEYQIVNIRDLEGKFQAGDTVDTVSLFMKGLVRKPELPVKLLGEGQIEIALTISVDAVSSSAKTKIEAAGGKVEVPAATGSSADA